jgi:hypothetical protein
LRSDRSLSSAACQLRQLRGEDGRDREHRSRLFAAVLKLDGEDPCAPRLRQQGQYQGATGVIAAFDRARLSRSERGSSGIVRVAPYRR